MRSFFATVQILRRGVVDRVETWRSRVHRGGTATRVAGTYAVHDDLMRGGGARQILHTYVQVWPGEVMSLERIKSCSISTQI